MGRARVLCVLLMPVLIIAFLPSFFHLSDTDGDDLVDHYAVYCIGDSLTAADSYQAELRRLLGADYTVVNKGIGGDITPQMLGRFAGDVVSQYPGWVIIWAGINDVRIGISSQYTKSNLQSMYTLAHDAGIRVIAVNLSPCQFMFTYPWNDTKQAVLEEINDWIADTAVNVDFRIDVYSVLEDPDRPDYLLPAYDSGDHLHLNSTGYAVVGQAIYNAVDWTVPSAPTAKGGLPFWVWIVIGVCVVVGAGLLAYVVRRGLVAQTKSSESADD